MITRAADEGVGRGRARAPRKEPESEKRVWGVHRYRLVQPTDVNENKELPLSSDFLSPLSTGKPVGHGRKHNGGRNERGGKRKKK